MKVLLENNKWVVGSNKEDIIAQLAVQNGLSIEKYMQIVYKRCIKWNGQKIEYSSIGEFFDQLMIQRVIKMYVM